MANFNSSTGVPAGLGGAFDLSSLVKQSAPPAKPAHTVSATPAGKPEPVLLPDVVLEVSPSGLAKFVKISERVPVLVEFHTTRSEGSLNLSKKLAAEVQARAGAVILLRIDGDNAGQLLQAFNVQGLPSVNALLMGQPVPMFNGDQEAETIKLVIDKLLQLALENGITEIAQVDLTAEMPAEPAMNPRHQAAYEAIEAEDYAKAVAEFEAALAQSPADAIAATGLAQASLLLRTDKLDFEQVLQTPANSLEAVIQKADILAVVGHFDKAFQALLDAFGVATKEDRETLRLHLLELFKAAGPGHPEVAKARTRLTSLLY
ncbi:MAG: hypothetical protein RL530_820 [Actinomycetota bacterium]